MKLGEIKIEALKLMFADYADDIDIDSLTDLASDENYGKYLNNMPGAINRCFSRLEERNAVPTKKTTLDNDNGTSANGRIRFDLSAIADFGKVDRVIYESSKEYDGNCPFNMETNTIMLLPEKDGDYILIYSPILERIQAGSDNESVIDLPDKIACLIPYFIKGDLYTEDEPGVAAEARNLFEASLDDMTTVVKTKQNKVNCIFSQTED